MQGQAWADPAQPAAAAAVAPSQIAPGDREKVLGKGWNASNDRAWTTSGDAAGFHVLVADQKAGYGWRTAATLAEPGFDADMWIGNACVTGSGKRAVVAYAPRTFTNKPELMARGAFTAVVDLDSGAVTKLDRQASLAYFSPGCGTGETAVLTQAGGDTKNQTRLLTVDVATAKVSRTTELAGQVTSAIPVGKDIVAADSARLTRIDQQGRRTTLARTGQVPFGLKADAEGGLVYLDRPAGTNDKGEVKRITASDITRGNADKTKQSVLARGALTRMDVSSSAGGAVFITGDTQAADPLPKTVQRRPDVPKDSQATTGAKALVTKVAAAGESDPRKQLDLSARTARISLKVLATGRDTDFTVTPSVPAAQAAAGTAPSPALRTQGTAPAPAPAAPKPATALGSFALAAPKAASLAEDERYCSVGRNDPAKQTMQPKPRQVEWAVDQIVNGTLDKHVSRPANWKNLGMPAYQPQTLFPRLGLNSGGRIPAQVLLGITAQESNMWQASRVVVPGVTGNPLIGNYYGIKYAANGQQNDPWGINWAEADCGYGITQITDGMRMHGREKTGEVATLSKLQQEAAALDYTANVAAGQRVLADKWNITNQDGLFVNNGDPKYIENWFFALWAYNSGYYPKAAAGNNGGLWGVGFTNNPANPLWKANRTPFLEGPAGADDYSQAAHPQDWPYQEKVIGWAARPLEGMESPGKMVSGFRAAWWTNNALRSTAKPAEGLFCTSANNCDPSKIGPNDKNDPGLGACNREDLKCWWNQPVKWKDCTKAECGNELMRFDDTYKEEADGTAYPPNCTTQGLPANALIVDDVPDGTPISRPGCSLPKATSGTFSLDFATPSARIDFQQLGAGYGGHFWFAHTRKDDALGQRMKVTGTWQLSKVLDGAAKVFVHLPDHGAHTKFAKYEILTPHGWRESVVEQKGTGNRWVDIGAYQFKGSAPQVRLSSITSDGTGDQDIAFDAVAFVPGDYSGMPDISFGDGDPNAPEFDQTQQKKTEVPTPPMNFSWAPTVTKSSKFAAPAASSADFTCQLSGTTFNRYEACLNSSTPLAFSVLKDGKKHTAKFNVSHQIQLHLNETSIDQRIIITPVSIDPGLGNIRLEWRSQCGATCQDVGSPTWYNTPTWSPGDTHVAVGGLGKFWSGTSGTETLQLESVLTGISPIGGATTTWKDDDLAVRCDAIIGDETKPGCVFSKFIPTYTVNSKKYPAAAALYWVLMERLQTHPGSERHKSPLSRQADTAISDKNRDKICDRTFIPVPNGQTGDRNKSSCDEYPFAKARESGGATLGSGKECAQFYAIWEKKPGETKAKWRLKYHTSFPLPSYKEICGRGDIPLGQNSAAGGGLGNFTKSVRLHDKDRYYVSTPGFENCNQTLCELP
ncbi:hypothetical protein [Streptomyces sp. NRRL S-241]|uniref:golvesin C-terminal-like domain-containing protein n=1 Tax=Streptomyces sp. NRRL S-241 TaxID=1463896 RepID=UPI00131E9C02|nr:hypothetical protein [Streptomyces sp. NRRL S-241]